MKQYSVLAAKQKLAIILILIAALTLWVVDAVDDLSHGSTWTHLGLEGIILSFAAYWIVSIAIRYFVSRRENLQMRVDLAAVKKDLEDFKLETRHLTKGLSLKIDEQLEKWQMTTAEKEIALFILKGLANKEIAEVRGTSEKTVTQQITAIYQKSGLHNRSEFAAFFLEDLLMPQTTEST